jgi:hypothetical protein
MEKDTDVNHHFDGTFARFHESTVAVLNQENHGFAVSGGIS